MEVGFFPGGLFARVTFPDVCRGLRDAGLDGRIWSVDGRVRNLRVDVFSLGVGLVVGFVGFLDVLCVLAVAFRRRTCHPS